jgi:hypothetical protein
MPAFRIRELAEPDPPTPPIDPGDGRSITRGCPPLEAGKDTSGAGITHGRPVSGPARACRDTVRTPRDAHGHKYPAILHNLPGGTPGQRPF